MARTRNPRRIVVDHIRAVRYDLGAIVRAWDVSGRVFIEDAEPTTPAERYRPREAHEYPEHNPDQWARVAEDADHIAESMTALARYAREQHAELLDRRQAEKAGRS